MKHRIPPVSLLSALVLLLVAMVAGPARAQDKHDEFLLKFRQAMEINAKDEMVKLVRTYPDEAAGRVILTCDQIAEQSSDGLETLIAALAEAWKGGIGGGFVDWAYEYFSLLSPSSKREYKRLKSAFSRLEGRFFEASREKEGPALELIGGELVGLAQGFESIGNSYHASNTWLMYAECYDESLREGKQDLEKVTRGLGAGLELRKKVELEDSWYKSKKVRYDFLVAQGWADDGSEEVEGPDEGAEPAQPTDPAEPGATPAAAPASGGVIPMSFALIETFDMLERPQYNADPLYPMWYTLNFTKKGSITRFESIENSPTFIRAGSADVRIDANADGSPDGDPKIPLTGNMVPIEVKIGRGEDEREWAFLAVTGLEKDIYQGIQMNLQATDDVMPLYVLPAGSMVGKVGETPIRIVDDNLDGIYGSPPTTWGYIGISKDMYQPDMDSIVIGSEEYAKPWSEFQNIDGQWYQFEAQKGGKEQKVAPAKVRTGTLKLKYKGPLKPNWLVVRGSNKYENSFFDLAHSPKGVDVPVGRWSLFYGELRKGKKLQMMKSLILPGPKSPSWNVVAGETTEIELGAPYGFDFRFARDGDQLTVHGESVVITGQASERYERVWNSGPKPQVSWRKAGTKRGSKAQKMSLVLDNDGITKHGWRAAWSPLDMVLNVKKAGEEKVEVQLIQKKNKLFGKINSDWKE